MQTLPEPSRGHLWLVIAPAGELLLDLASRLALSGALRVVDGGNCFNAYTFSRLLRKRLPADEPFGFNDRLDDPPRPRLPALLRQVTVARAFTCYQMVALLSELPPSPVPVLALEVLNTFYDEDVKLPESRRLLADCLRSLQRLSRMAPVVMSACPPVHRGPSEDRTCLLEALEEAAQRTVRVEAPVLRSPQMALFT